MSVNAQSAYRRGEYYHKELAIDNSSAPVWQSVTNLATYGGQTDTNTGNLLLPKTPQTFWYDNDGNNLGDFVWTNSWDAENRMLSAENTTALPSAGRAKETWTFDGEGRWVQRVIYSWNGSAYALQATNRFLWDQNVLVAILDQANALSITFQRGLDLGGSLQDSGGVGSVVAINIVTNGVHFCGYDGNGNLVALVSGITGTPSGAYEYDPFANPLRITGAPAKANPIRFSTQFADVVRGVTKYLHRNYDHSLGRWNARDPFIEEAFAKFSKLNVPDEMPHALILPDLNEFRFVMNSPLSMVDHLGGGILCSCNLSPPPLPLEFQPTINNAGPFTIESESDMGTQTCTLLARSGSYNKGNHLAELC